MPKSLKAVEITTTIQDAYDKAEKGKPLRLTMKDGENGPLEIVDGTEDLAIEAGSGLTGILAAPIVCRSGRRLILDGTKGTVRTDAERKIIGIDDLGTVYEGKVMEGLRYEGPEFVLVGKGQQKDRQGNPGVTVAPFDGTLVLSGDYLRDRLDHAAVTVFLRVDSRNPKVVNPKVRAYTYTEAEV